VKELRNCFIGLLREVFYFTEALIPIYGSIAILGESKKILAYFDFIIYNPPSNSIERKGGLMLNIPLPMFRRTLFFLAVFSLSLLFSPVSADNLSCLICHSSIKGKVTTKKGEFEIGVDGERFGRSVHRDLDCTNCHLSYIDNPHKSIQNDVPEPILMLSKTLDKKAIFDPIAQAACVQCHDEIYQAYRKSVHGKNIFDKKEVDAPSCPDCHGSAHYIMDRKKETSPVDSKHILGTCGHCHEKKELAEKYRFSKKVLERYKESFHGKKFLIGHKGAPVCTTCHGSHDIKEVGSPDSPVFGKNRLKTCGNCHPGANERFVAAITHKPVGRDNPIPYYFEKGLIILTITVISGTVFHVLIEAYGNLRDYLIKKRRSEDESR